MRVVLCILPALTALSANASNAQSADATSRGAQRAEAPEEVIVRGRQIGELRIAAQDAREHAYAIFNEINSTDDFDVLCKDERKYHSRATKRVCRARFESRISAEAAKEYFATMGWTCQPAAGSALFIDTQACMFSGPGVNATARARAVEGQAPPLHERMNDEILRLANENEAFAQAILDFYEADRRYKEARGRGAEED
jgi:hypothetical protein